MPTLRFPTLLWQDAAGLFTAVPVEAVDEETAGFGATAAAALQQLRDFLAWQYRRQGTLPHADFLDAELRVFKVLVRPEYHFEKRVYVCETALNLPVHCVAGRNAGGLLVAALPLLGVRFYYHDKPALKTLACRYAEQALKGLTPEDLARFLSPPLVRLEEVALHVKQRVPRPPVDTTLPALAQVAEALGDRFVQRQFNRAWERESLLKEAVHKLHHEGTNLLLVGEPGVGKTTLLVDAVRMVEALCEKKNQEDKDAPAGTHRFWLTAAGRLIAGMKYLGQWEDRCEQIIDELARLPGVLCVDRLLDLVRMGGTGPTDSLAAFFMPYLQRGELRLVGECTPGELGACRRLLPSFADLFPLVHVPAFDRRQALTVLDRLLERHTRNLRLPLEPGVSDRVYQLFRRFAPYQEFPGPAASFIHHLCERKARSGREPVAPADAVSQFARRSGLPAWLLSDETPLDAGRLLDDFRRQVIGQEEAVRAAAQLVMTFKAGLHDPQRPLGVLLFCGPTGVGKTEMARALARTFFGHGEPLADAAGRKEDRLVRLDMSEYAGPDAVDRLLGAPRGDPSSLVRRLRQQPFCVLLFDEIEKAAPEVFDVLLGVCDEGRLTDSFGRTTTFRSAIIIMTSNLGAGEGERFGFGDKGPAPYAAAVRKFFRPEFFNRLDAVVTFQALAADTIRAITRKELTEIGSREGLQRANLRLCWSDTLLDLLAREGFDARFGARPLQRTLERRVLTPLAKFLLANPERRDVKVCLECDDAGQITAVMPR
jgi:ATP-dependent Clp protease ATP-binding subunit ClpC